MIVCATLLSLLSIWYHRVPPSRYTLPGLSNNFAQETKAARDGGSASWAGGRWAMWLLGSAQEMPRLYFRLTDGSLPTGDEWHTTLGRWHWETCWWSLHVRQFPKLCENPHGSEDFILQPSASSALLRVADPGGPHRRFWSVVISKVPSDVTVVWRQGELWADLLTQNNAISALWFLGLQQFYMSSLFTRGAGLWLLFSLSQWYLAFVVPGNM